jgi:hypothetical protein
LFFGAVQLLPLLGRWTGAEGTAMSMTLMTIAWTIVAAVVCGFVTALIAGSHEFPHVAAVGMLMVGLSFLSMRQEALSRPSWYQIAIAGCGPISAFVGAAMQTLRRVSKGH